MTPFLHNCIGLMRVPIRDLTGAGAGVPGKSRWHQTGRTGRRISNSDPMPNSMNPRLKRTPCARAQRTQQRKPAPPGATRKTTAYKRPSTSWEASFFWRLVQRLAWCLIGQVLTGRSYLNRETSDSVRRCEEKYVLIS